MKKLFKKYIPPAVWDYLSGMRAAISGRRVFAYDRKRFLSTYAPLTISRNSRAQLDGRLTFSAHSIEKGLSHEDIRYGFGERALRRLAAAMFAYVEQGFPLDGTAYINAQSVIKEYINVHKEAGKDTSLVDKIFDGEILTAATESKPDIGGAMQIDSTDKRNNRNVNFEQLFINRWSVREYADSPVDGSLVDKAISISTKSPSVCNRQSGRVQVIDDPEMIESTLAIQGGFTGYKLPPMLLMITTDNSSFLDIKERNQVYIDGGLFAMSLLLSLEYVSLAACPLNAMLNVSRDKQMRELLNIPKNENIIMFAAVGNFKESYKVPKSFRYKGEEITRS